MKTGLLVAADLYGCAEDALARDALKNVLEEYAETNHMHMQSIRIEQENENNYGIYSICKAYFYFSCCYFKRYCFISFATSKDI